MVIVRALPTLVLCTNNCLFIPSRQDLGPIFGFARLLQPTAELAELKKKKKRKTLANKNREKTFGDDSMNAHLHFKTMLVSRCSAAKWPS
jgi:hypothetical protein